MEGRGGGRERHSCHGDSPDMGDRCLLAHEVWRGRGSREGQAAKVGVPSRPEMEPLPRAAGEAGLGSALWTRF